MNRYDIETRRGTLSLEVEIISTDKIDDFETLDFYITVKLPPGFNVSDERIGHLKGNTFLEMETSHKITPEDCLTI